MTTTNITRELVSEDRRIDVTAELFGMHFPMKLEPFVFSMADTLASNYSGGLWHFYTLSNGAFYMVLHSAKVFKVSCENGFEGELSADALGIVACLYAYSHLSFGDGEFSETCAEQYHLLREYMFEHEEVALILGAID